MSTGGYGGSHGLADAFRRTAAVERWTGPSGAPTADPVSSATGIHMKRMSLSAVGCLACLEPAIPFVAAVVLMQAVQPRPVIRRSVDLVTTTVVVHDERGQFVPNLAKDDFELFEDGVRQEPVMFVFTHGGRIFKDVGAPPPAREGLLLPPA